MLDPEGNEVKWLQGGNLKQGNELVMGNTALYCLRCQVAKPYEEVLIVLRRDAGGRIMFTGEAFCEAHYMQLKGATNGPTNRDC